MEFKYFFTNLNGGPIYNPTHRRFVSPSDNSTNFLVVEIRASGRRCTNVAIDPYTMFMNVKEEKTHTIYVLCCRMEGTNICILCGPHAPEHDRENRRMLSLSDGDRH